jgi:hypothetical protein
VIPGDRTEKRKENAVAEFAARRGHDPRSGTGSCIDKCKATGYSLLSEDKELRS